MDSSEIAIDFPMTAEGPNVPILCVFFVDISVSLRRIWTKLVGNSSYEPPGASYIAQGP